MTMSKTQAIAAARSNALATINRSEAARETLEQIVVGKTSFGAHSKQAAETALVALAMRQSPDASAFLLRLLAEPDDKIRALPTATIRRRLCGTTRLVSDVASDRPSCGWD